MRLKMLIVQSCDDWEELLTYWRDIWMTFQLFYGLGGSLHVKLVISLIPNLVDKGVDNVEY
jgi:hypothetical protein